MRSPSEGLWDWWRMIFLTVAAIIALTQLVQGQVSVEPPPHKVVAGWPAFYRIHGVAAADLASVSIKVKPVSCFAAIQQGKTGGLFIWFEPTSNGPHALSIAIGGESAYHEVFLVDVGGDNPTPPPPQPPPPGDVITAAIVRGWLATVPVDVRTEVIEDPVTGESYTRQEAVGKTFSEIGGVVTSLGSIRAANVMLTTGLAAAFGPKASEWKSFAESVDEALARAEQKRITPTEYGKILSIIGGALL